MPTLSRCVALAVAAGVGTAATLNRAEPPPPEEGHPPLVSWAGSHSGVHSRRIVLVSDEAAWETLWKEHAGEGIEKTAHGFAVWPKVDFHRCMVLAVFSGKETNGSGWRVLSAGERDRQTVIRVDWAGFQTSAPPGQRDMGVPTTGYGIGVVPRSALPVVVEENAQVLKDHPPKWRELARLAAAPLLAP